jgi:hypothetical protein
VSLGSVAEGGVQPESETTVENSESGLQLFVILHLKEEPVSFAVTVNPYVAVVALAPVALLHVEPFGLRSHWYEGLVTSEPTTTLKETEFPICCNGSETGCVVMYGGVQTVRVAALDVTSVLQELLLDTRQRNFQPFMAEDGVKTKF